MPLILSVTSSGEQMTHQGLKYEFDESGGTIGRKMTNTWILPDECRHLSGSHASVEYKNDAYYIIDTSTNGVFVNGSSVALGRGKRKELEDGFQLGMGTYNISVQISNKDEASNETPEVLADDLFSDLEEEPNIIDDSSNEIDPLQSVESDFQQQKHIGDLGSDDPFFEYDEFKTDDDLIDIPDNKAESVNEQQERQEFDSFFEPSKIQQPSRKANISTLNQNQNETRSVNENIGAESGAIPDNWDATSSKSSFDDLLTGIGDPFDLTKNENIQTEEAQVESAPSNEDANLIVEDNSESIINPFDGNNKEKYQQPKAATPVTNKQINEIAVESSSNDANQLMATFLDGLGFDVKNFDDDLSEKHLLLAGRLLRIAVQGTMEVLQSRAEIKNEMRMDMTTIRPTQNNPIKFAINTNEAISKLLVQKNKSYMDPVQAMEEAYDDIKSHQVAIISGIQASLVYVLKRFEPENLIKRLEKESPISANIPIHRKAKLWDKFEDLYDTIESEAEDDFNRLFGQEFAKAYDEQVAQLKKKREM